MAGVVLVLAGVITPLFGPMLGRNYGRASFALTLLGLAVFALAAIRRRPGRDEGTSDGNYGGATGTNGDAGGHDWDDGGHGGNGDR
jgi:hypothetical protein